MKTLLSRFRWYRRWRGGRWWQVRSGLGLSGGPWTYWIDRQPVTTGYCSREFVMQQETYPSLADGRIVAAIRDLVAEEGDSVEIYCDNTEGPPNNAVMCNGEWTNWCNRRYAGDTLEAALTAACFAKAERSGK